MIMKTDYVLEFELCKNKWVRAGKWSLQARSSLQLPLHYYILHSWYV